MRFCLQKQTACNAKQTKQRLKLFRVENVSDIENRSDLLKVKRGV